MPGVDFTICVREATAQPSSRPSGVVRLKHDFGIMELVRDTVEVIRNLVRAI
jgi:hypothetical protein